MNAPAVSRERLRADVRELFCPGLTPASAYRVLRNALPGALVEVSPGGAEPAHAFVALDPLETIALDRDRTMLDTIRRTFERYREMLVDSVPGYGLVCTFAYDAALRLQGIVAPMPGHTYFPEAFAIVPGTWLWFDGSSGSVMLGGLSRTPGERSETLQRLDAYEARLRSAAPSSVSEGEVVSEEDGRAARASLSRSEYAALVARAKRAIGNGDVYQIVLAIRFSAPFAGDALDVYRGLTVLNPSPYAFLIERNGCALTGASPEFLVRLRDDIAELRPLAGTRPRGANVADDGRLAADLLADVKERAEHAMLVDLGRNDLSRACSSGSVRVERAFALERYSHVMHLASTVTGRLAHRQDAFDLFAATFPAGTVTGTPKRRAMELIAGFEPCARGLYAGSVVHARFDGAFDAALTLRSIVLTGREAIWNAGAGIVYRSDPDAEYAEVMAKSAIARAVLRVKDGDGD